MENITENKFGKTFAPSMVFAGYLFIAFGVFALMSTLGGLIPIFMGAFVSFTYGGVKIDFNNKKYLDYSSLFFIKFGKWKSYSNLPYLTVEFKILSTRASNDITASSTETSKDAFYEFYLLDESKNKKQLLKRIKDGSFNKEEINEYKNLLEVELTTVKPRKTSSRRPRR